MKLIKIIKTGVLCVLFSPLMAQQNAEQARQLNSTTVSAKAMTDISISKEQMEAIQQIELEFEAREKRRKEVGRSFSVNLVEREKERTAKIKMILSPQQWKKYQEITTAMIAGEKKMLAAKKGKKIDGNKPVLID